MSRIVLAALLTLATGFACPKDDLPEPPPAQTLVLQDSDAARATYEEHAAGWLTWMAALPFSTGPVTDTTGEACDQGQSGEVWYLAGTPGGVVERTCDIPAGQTLFFPLVNRWAMNADIETIKEPVVAWFQSERANTCELTLKLDGEPLLPDTAAMDEALYVDVLEPFAVSLDADNFNSANGFAGGDYEAITDGHFAMLSPLAPGEHVLELGGAICDGEEVVFEVAAAYNLNVVE
jgi:hypothetical protein